MTFMWPYSAEYINAGVFPWCFATGWWYPVSVYGPVIAREAQSRGGRG